MNTQRIFLLISSLFFNLALLAQDNTGMNLQWQRSLGGSGWERLSFQGVQETTDGGSIVVGETTSKDGDVSGGHGKADYWVVKLDQNGKTEWQKTLGGKHTDAAYAVQQCWDGGYLAVGQSSSKSDSGDVSTHFGKYDAWLVKLDNSGEISWERTIGSMYNEGALSIRPTLDGGYIMGGWRQPDTSNKYSADFWIVKLDMNGLTEWEKTIGGSGDDVGLSVLQTYDGGYMIAGSSISTDNGIPKGNGDYDAYIVKLDHKGLQEWQTKIGGSNKEWVWDMQETADKNYVLAGFSLSNDGDIKINKGAFDAWVAKIDQTGALIWQKTYGGSKNEEARSIVQTPDGGYMVAGYSESSDGDLTTNYGGSDYWLFRLNDKGELLWQQNYGGSGTDLAHSLVQNSDGTYTLSGYSASTDNYITGHKGDHDIWMLKLAPANSTTINSVKLSASIEPNPLQANSILSISGVNSGVYQLNIIDALGKIVYSGTIIDGKFPIGQQNLNKGFYIYRVNNAKETIVKGNFIVN